MSEQQPEQSGVTVEQAKISLMSERLGNMERRHSEEVIDLRVQHLLETQNLRQELEELRTENADLRSQAEAKGTKKPARS